MLLSELCDSFHAGLPSMSKTAMFDLSLLKAPSETAVIRLLRRLSTRNLGISSKGEPCTAQIRLLSIYTQKGKRLYEAALCKAAHDYLPN